MRAVGIVVGSPGFDDPPDRGQAGKDVLIEALITQPADQTLDECVLHRLAGRNVVPADAAILLPTHHRVRGQLCAVVAHYQQRRAAEIDDPIKLAVSIFLGRFSGGLRISTG